MFGCWEIGVKGNEGPVSFLFLKTVIERSFCKQREYHFGVTLEIVLVLKLVFSVLSVFFPEVLVLLVSSWFFRTIQKAPKFSNFWVSCSRNTQ